MTERLPFHFSLSCIGEGNGNPLQCSCLENRRDGGSWWAAISGVAQSRTQLKPLSSSSSSAIQQNCIVYSFYILGTTNLCPASVKMLGTSLSTHCRNFPSAFVVEQMEAQETSNRFSQDSGDIKHQNIIRVDPHFSYTS